MVGGGAVQHGEGPMVVDGEDMGATVIAVVTRCLINPCPGFAMGIRTMVVVTVQGAPPLLFFVMSYACITLGTSMTTDITKANRREP